MRGMAHAHLVAEISQVFPHNFATQKLVAGVC
jgi:hypothetical protein